MHLQSSSYFARKATVLSVRRSAQIRVPENAFKGDLPLVAVVRGSYVGSLHRGSAVAVDGSGDEVLAIGDPDEHVFLRSGAKPFQVVPAVLSGGLDRYGITQRELAVLCASHSGEQRHTEAVLSVLKKIGLDETALRCGVHPPLHQGTARQRWSQGLEPTPVCNNCSGAHTAMLVACQANHWPISNYGDIDHPLQKMTLDKLAQITEIEPSAIELGVDNCAVPTFRLPLKKAALAYARLARPTGTPEDLTSALKRIASAMTSFPEMVGGEDRFDSDLMRAAKRKLVAKGGAEAFHGLGIEASGLGVALKISDGSAAAVPSVVMRILSQLEALDDDELHHLEKYREPEVRNLQDEPVGRFMTVFNFGDNS